MNNTIETFINYCKMDEFTLKTELFIELKKYYKKLRFGDGFILAKGNMPVMLVAHLDTIHRKQCTDADIYVSRDNNIVKSDNGIGGDDRCGVFMIMDIIKNTKHRPYVLFTEDEECGGLGAKMFIKRYNKSNTKLNFIIELDRANSIDSVYYDLDNKDFEKYINKYGFKTAIGSYTDICDLCPAFDCAGVNLSCGYYKAHTTNEYVNIREMLNTTYKVARILEDFKQEDDFKYVEKEYVYTYSLGNYKNYKHYKPTNKDNLYSSYYDGYDYYYNTPKDDDYYFGEGYQIYETCDYCGQSFPLKECRMVEDGSTYICEHCMKRFGMKECKECGVAMFYGTDGDLCIDCKKWHKQLEEQERLEI